MRFEFSPRLALAAIIAAVLLPGTIMGQGAARPPAEPPDLCADQEPRFAARMAFIEAKTVLRPEQRGDWDGFVTASRAAQQSLWNICAPPSQLPSTALARLELREKVKAAAGTSDMLQRIANANLLKSLNPEQQERFAEALLREPLRMFAGTGAGDGPLPFGPPHLLSPGFSLPPEHGFPPRR